MADRTDIRPSPDSNPNDRRAAVHNTGQNETPMAPDAPGGTASPQVPGARPDRSSIPGHGVLPVPPATVVHRPLTQYGTAQEIMGVYAPKPGEAMDPARFEQATATWEEVRKAYPAQLPAQRPAPGFALKTGDAIASEAQAIGGLDPAVLASRAGADDGSVPIEDIIPGNPSPPAEPSDPGRSGGDAMRGLTMGSGDIGTSRWQDASPSPGDATTPAGTLPAASPAPADDKQEERGDPPAVAPQ